MDLFYNKLKISKEDFLFQYHSHPNCPSALAFSDTLNFLGIKNEAYEIEKDNWNELPEQFIAIYKNQFAIIEKRKTDYLITTDKIEKKSTDELYSDCMNIVIVFDLNENQQNAFLLNYKWIKIIVLFFILVCFSFQFKADLFLFNLLSVIGVFLSLEIFKSKFGNNSFVINKLCSSNFDKNVVRKDTCEKIIGTDKINILGLRLSDFSLIYFLTIATLGLLLPQSIFFLKIISYATILVIIYSLITQFFIEKAICKVCLLIISILLGQIIIVKTINPFNFNLELLFVSLFVFTAIFFTIKYINDILHLKDELLKSSLKNYKFKRNYEIFRKELKEKHLNFKYKNDVFFLGDKNAKLNISLITNPFCGYCKEAHFILEKLLNEFSNISAQIRFNYVPEQNMDSIITIFKNIYDTEGEKSLMEAIGLWYDASSKTDFEKKYEVFSGETNMNEIVALTDDNKNHGLTFTPVFLINNYQFPTVYDKEDIFYFVNEMLEDEELLNEKL